MSREGHSGSEWWKCLWTGIGSMCGRISKEGGIESTFWQNNGPVFTLFVITWRLWFLVFSWFRIRCCYFFFLLVAVVGFDAVLLRTSSAFCASGIRLRKSRPLLWNHFVVAGWLSVLPLWCFWLGVCGLSNISERGRSRSRQRRTRKRSKSRSQSGFLRLFSWLGVICIGGPALDGETAFYVRFGRERERVTPCVCVFVQAVLLGWSFVRWIWFLLAGEGGGVGEVVGTGDFGLLLCWRFVDCCL